MTPDPEVEAADRDELIWTTRDLLACQERAERAEERLREVTEAATELLDAAPYGTKAEQEAFHDARDALRDVLSSLPQENGE